MKTIKYACFCIWVILKGSYHCNLNLIGFLIQEFDVLCKHCFKTDIFHQQLAIASLSRVWRCTCTFISFSRRFYLVTKVLCCPLRKCTFNTTPFPKWCHRAACAILRYTEWLDIGHIKILTSTHKTAQSSYVHLGETNKKNNKK